MVVSGQIHVKAVFSRGMVPVYQLR